MRRFSSYGPVDHKFHFAVERKNLIDRCVDSLLGAPGEGGHFFTIWAARQAGKTWLMRRAIQEIRARYGDKFLVGSITLQAVLQENDGDDVFLKSVPGIFRDGFSIKAPVPSNWDAWRALFAREGGLFDKPIILLLDEFDSMPQPIIDKLVSEFRKIYLVRDNYWIHGLALIGVRAVLGVDSPRGSPFNVQRSLHVPNLTSDEVADLFHQYSTESGQTVLPEVVGKVFEVTRGQPGLVSWFGELLVERYNPVKTAPIGMDQWHEVYAAACQIEPNNTVMNLIAKARRRADEVARLYAQSDVAFSFDEPWCNELYMNGVIDTEKTRGDDGLPRYVCRFSSPFVQRRLYAGLALNMADRRVPVVDPHDDLTEVFASLDLPALMGRYRDYLKRLAAAGIHPWKDQARRADLHITEAAGHFHLYWWLIEASGRNLGVSPEFPTGNGKVDLHVTRRGKTGVIEVKSFTQRSDLPWQREQAAGYAKSRGLTAATLALFVPTDDEALLQKLSTTEEIEGVTVTTVAITAV